MRTIFFIGIFYFFSGVNQAQVIDFVAVCDVNTKKTLVVRSSDTTAAGKYEVLSQRFPNRQLAQNWMAQNYPDGSCNAVEEKIKPGIPKNAGTESPSDKVEVPEKRVKYFYKNRFGISYALRDRGIEDLPSFEATKESGQAIGIRWLSGNAFQWGYFGRYAEDGVVKSFDNAGVFEDSLKWANVEVGLLFAYPINLVPTSKNLWLIPSLGIGGAWQNIFEAGPESFEVETRDGGGILQFGIEIDLFHVCLGALYVMDLNHALDVGDEFKFKGFQLSAGLAF